jgi:hypothetical protein
MQEYPDTVAFFVLVLATFVLWGAVSRPKLLRAAQVIVSFASLFFAFASFYFFTVGQNPWACVIASIALSNIAAVTQRVRSAIANHSTRTG